MDSVQHMLRQARRRELIDQTVSRAGWGLLFASGSGLALLLGDRLADLHVPIAAYAILLGLGLLGGFVFAALNQPPRIALAVKLDRELHLKDRIGSAMSVKDILSGRAHVDPEFAELLQRDAQRLAESVDVRRATPVRFTRVWAASLPLIALLWVGVFFLPALGWLRPAEAALNSPSAEVAAQTQQQANQITQTISNAVANLPRDESLDQKTRDDLEALDRLSQQLSDPNQTPEQLVKARDESSARLNEAADRLAKQAQRDLAASDALARQFGGLNSPNAPKPPMSAEAFSEALRRGDFGEAAKQLDQLLESDALTPQQRREAADHLRDLASRLDQSKELQPRDVDALREQIEQVLHDQGADEQKIKYLLEHPPQTAEELQRELERPLDEDNAERLTHDLQEQHEQKQIDDQVQRDQQDVKQSLNDAAKDLESPPPSGPPATQPTTAPIPPQSQPSMPPATQPQDQKPNQTRPPLPESQPQQNPPEMSSRDQQQQQNAADQNQNQNQTSQEESQQPSTQPQGSPSQQQPAPSQPQSQPTQQQNQQQQQQQQQQPAKQDRGSSQQQQQQQQKQQGSNTQQQNGAQSKPGQQGESQSAQPGSQQNPNGPTQQVARENTGDHNTSATQDKNDNGQLLSQDNTSPESGDKSRQQQPTPSRSGQPQQSARQTNSQDRTSNQPQERPSPSDTLRKLAERREAAGDRQQSSEKMRQAARELAERMTPQEREEWARQWQRERGEQPPTPQNPNPQQPQNPSQPQQSSASDAERLAGPRGTGAHPNGSPSPNPDQRNPDQPPTFKTDKLDLRGSEQADQVIAQWLNQDVPAQPGQTSAGSPPPRVKQAQDVAERAVNEAAVNKRYYKIIQRYFGRLDETVQKASGETNSPAPNTPRAAPAANDNK